MLDQTVFAGLENYLRSEILFDTKIRLYYRQFDLNKTSITQWAKSIKNISHLAYKTGGFTVSKYLQIETKRMKNQVFLIDMLCSRDTNINVLIARVV